MGDLRILSYLPNPRIWKATIAARLLGVDVEVRGAPPGELAQWLWDFDARPLTERDRGQSALQRSGRTGFTGELFKTDGFLAAHPFGTVPAAFSPDGATGIFESNSIMRAVARLGNDEIGLYGRDPYTASRVDSFLDASLVFARDSQIYLLSLGTDRLTVEIHDRARAAFDSYMSGIDHALRAGSAFVAGAELTLADICFVAEVSLFSRERAWTRTIENLGTSPIDWDGYEIATAHYDALCAHEAFAPDVGPFLEKLRADIARHSGPG